MASPDREQEIAAQQLARRRNTPFGAFAFDASPMTYTTMGGNPNFEPNNLPGAAELRTKYANPLYSGQYDDTKRHEMRTGDDYKLLLDALLHNNENVSANPFQQARSLGVDSTFAQYLASIFSR